MKPSTSTESQHLVVWNRHAQEGWSAACRLLEMCGTGPVYVRNLPATISGCPSFQVSVRPSLGTALGSKASWQKKRE